MSLDRYEMGCRMLEAMTGGARPPGLSAKEAFSRSGLDDQQRDGLMQGVDAAIAYVYEALGHAEPWG